MLPLSYVSLSSCAVCSVSVTLTYPVDTIKTRLQAKDFKPTDKGICDLYKGMYLRAVIGCEVVSHGCVAAVDGELIAAPYKQRG